MHANFQLNQNHRKYHNFPSKNALLILLLFTHSSQHSQLLSSFLHSFSVSFVLMMQICDLSGYKIVLCQEVPRRVLFSFLSSLLEHQQQKESRIIL